DWLVERGGALLDVEVVGLHLPASIRRGDLGGKENHNLGPGTAGSRVIIADALTLLVDSRPHGTRQRGTLGLRYPFAAKKLGARERLRLELGCRCGRNRLRMRCFAPKPEHEERAHERPCKMAHGPLSPRNDWNFIRKFREATPSATGQPSSQRLSRRRISVCALSRG